MGAEESAYVKEEELAARRRRDFDAKKKVEELAKEYAGKSTPRSECPRGLDVDKYHKAAVPIDFRNVQNAGWTFELQGMPAYVNLPDLGAGVVIASKADEFGTAQYVVGIFDVIQNSANRNDPGGIPLGTFFGPIKCDTLWQVNAGYVALPDMVVRAVRQAESQKGRGVGLTVELLTKQLDQETGKVYSYVENMPWEKFLDYEKQPKTSGNIALALFRIDHAKKLLTEPRWFDEVIKKEEIKEVAPPPSEPISQKPKDEQSMASNPVVPSTVTAVDSAVPNKKREDDSPEKQDITVGAENCACCDANSSTVGTGYRYIARGAVAPFKVGFD